jgi:hypothetical protein
MRGKPITYRWSRLTLAADTPLPELPECVPDAAPSWTIALTVGRAPARPGRRWFHHWEFPDGSRWAAFAREGRGYVVRFAEVGDFDIDIDRRIIRCYRQPDAPEYTLRHLLLDQVLPLLVGDASHLAVHASVVGTDRGALVLLGASGHGKSSLAACLAQRGYPVLSDDCCVLRRAGATFDVVPSYPGVRLKPDAISGAWREGVSGPAVAHYSTKMRVDRDHGLPFRDTPAPLGSLYVIAPRRVLETAERVAIDPMSPRQAMLDLVDYTFHLDIHDEARMRQAFALAGDVAGSHRTRSLAFPWDLSQVDPVADAVLQDLV